MFWHARPGEIDEGLGLNPGHPNIWSKFCKRIQQTLIGKFNGALLVFRVNKNYK